MQFLKDKFEFLIVTLVLAIAMSIWVFSDYRPDVKEFLIAVFGAWLALLRIVQKPNVQTNSINAENIEAANTESGDIVAQPDTETTTNKE